jgi:hypothetical protein
MEDYPAMPTEAMMFIIVTGVIWLAYEIYVLYYKKETISHGMYKLAIRHPIIPFFIGVLMGHWFW